MRSLFSLRSLSRWYEVLLLRKPKRLVCLVIASLSVSGVIILQGRVNGLMSQMRRRHESAEIPFGMIDVEQRNLSNFRLGRNWTSQVKFMVLGAQKSGTSSLHKYMVQHPLIVRDQVKEKHCFKFKWDATDPLCERMFRVSTLLANPRLIAGDFTPNYLYFPFDVIPRLQAAFPHIKLIAILRNPVDRSFSQHGMELKYNRTTVDYTERILREMAALWRGGLIPHWKIQNGSDSLVVRGMDVASWLDAPIDHDLFLKFHGSPEEAEKWRNFTSRSTSTRGSMANSIAKGLYIIQLRLWMASFPRDRFLIFQTETMSSDSQAAVNKVFDHLNVNPFTLEDRRQINRGQREREGIPDDVRRLLEKLFAPYNDQLSVVLGDNWINSW